MSFSITRKISLTNWTSDGAQCPAPLATFSLVATSSKLWLGHVEYSRRAMSSASQIYWGG